ncbi:MAG: hypothetical protein ACRDT2_11015, partial [Natronosporangium sp.]
MEGIEAGSGGLDADTAYLYQLDYAALKAMVLARSPEVLGVYADRWRAVAASYQTKVEFLHERLPILRETWDSKAGYAYVDQFEHIVKAMDPGIDLASRNAYAFDGAADALASARSRMAKLDAITPPPASSGDSAPGPTPSPAPAPAPTQGHRNRVAEMNRDQFEAWRQLAAAVIAADLSRAYLQAMTELRDMPPFQIARSPGRGIADSGGSPTSRPRPTDRRSAASGPTAEHGRGVAAAPGAGLGSAAPPQGRPAPGTGGGLPLPPLVPGITPGATPGPGRAAPRVPASKVATAAPGVIGNRAGRGGNSHTPVGRTIGASPHAGGANTPNGSRAPGGTEPPRALPTRANVPGPSVPPPGTAGPGEPPITDPVARPPTMPPPTSTSDHRAPPRTGDSRRLVRQRHGLRRRPDDFRADGRTVGPVIEPDEAERPIQA